MNLDGGMGKEVGYWQHRYALGCGRIYYLAVTDNCAVLSRFKTCLRRIASTALEGGLLSLEGSSHELKYS